MASPIGSTVVPLYNGEKIPALGLGTWRSKPGEVCAAVEAAIDLGYRHIDCAAIYGNEKEVGEALRKKIEGGIDRKDLFITSKLWNTEHAAEDVRPALKKTIQDLQLDYLDLYLIHWPIGLQRGNDNFPKNEDGTLKYSETHYMETWSEMEKCVDEGLVKSIGLSNFNSKQVSQVFDESRIKPAALQCECHPYLNQQQLIDHCRKLNIVFVSYSPLGSPDRPWAKPGEPLLLEDPKLIEVGKKYNKTPAQVCIKWQIQRGLSVLPKSVNPDRIKQNSDIFDFELTRDDMKAVESFHNGWRACLPKITLEDGTVKERDAHHFLYPFNEPF